VAVTSRATKRAGTVEPSSLSPRPASASMLQLGEADPQVRRRAWADSLIGTRYFPPFFSVVRLMALEALAYHQMRPYPYWYFADWKVEERGILPRCLPLARRVVTRSAKYQ
jgi:hypothetical protein